MSKVKITIKKDEAPVFQQFMKEREKFTATVKESAKAIRYERIVPNKYGR